MGNFGRSPVISLASLDAAFIGLGRGAWPELIQRLVDLQLVETNCLARSQILWWYGKLIANSDMHLGNLSFTFNANTVDQKLSLTSVYDMLPMQYAPLAGGEVPTRQFVPELPLPQAQAAWLIAHYAALHFWKLASEDTRISQSFRQICAENLRIVKGLNAGKQALG